jgi:hypothetical protein
MKGMLDLPASNLASAAWLLRFSMDHKANAIYAGHMVCWDISIDDQPINKPCYLPVAPHNNLICAI